MRINYTVLKKILFLLFFCLAEGNLSAVPAFPDPVKFFQPDGSVLTIIIKGDEFLNWKESSDGYTLLHNQAGALEYAIIDDRQNLVNSGIIARDIINRHPDEIELLRKLPRKLFFSKEQIHVLKQFREIQNSEMNNMRKSPAASNATSAFPTTGERKLICVLAGFADKAFTLTQSDFNNLFNQLGYNADAATGSVRDYHLEVSYNQFDLTVDIAGPYTASQNMAYYGNNTNGNAKALVTEVVTAANADVNFADYDNDNDGAVDAVYVIFAGYGEEAGAPADAIWSHASSITALNLDGKSVSRYSCSPELRGNSGTFITRIGVICHEFGHVLGAPDYYDTDYETGGSFTGTGKWDMMAGGTWNNSGATPAHHNGWTKVMYYNWASVSTLSSPQEVILKNVSQFDDSFYRINTSTEGEYFFVENREKHLFDSYIPGSGMIIYRVHSGVLSVANRINATHPQRMYPVAQNATVEPTGVGTYGTINTSTCAWDGTLKNAFTDNSMPASKSWAGTNTFKPVTGISRNSTEKTVSFTFMGGTSCSPPPTQASGLIVSNQQDNQLTLNWTRGSGDNVIVLAKRGSPVNTTPLNGTSFSADSHFGLGDLIDAGTYVVYNGTGTNVTLTELQKNSVYYFAVFEYNATDNCYLSPALTSSATTTGCSPCIPTATTKGSIGITNVSLNTLSNTSAYSLTAYSDYSDMIVKLVQGVSYDLTISTYSYINTVYTKAWIDWDGDCSFELSEEYDFGSSTNNAVLTQSILVPEDAVPGFRRIRIRTRFGSAPTDCGINNSSECEDYTLRILDKTTTWNGSAWSDLQPETLRDVIIAGNYNADGFSCKSLIVNPGKQFSFNNGELVVSGNLTLKSDATGTATLIDYDSFTVNGNSVVEQYLPAARNWYLSSPLNEPNAPAGFSYFRYNETGNPLYWPGITPETTLTNVAGFIAQNSIPGVISFSGNGDAAFNTGTLTSQSLTRTGTASKPGFNLVGNPYPSYLNAAAAINGNTNLEKSLWYRSKNLSNTYVFDVVNTTSGIGTNNNGRGAVSGVVPPVQSFWVRLIPAALSTTISFNNTQRLHESQSMELKSPDESVRKLIRLSLSDGQNSDEAVIYFNDEASDGVDNFDSGKISNDNAALPEIFLFENNEKLAICAVSSSLISNLELDLGFKAGAQNALNLSVVEMKGFDQECNIELVDKLNGKEYSMNEGFIFNFEPRLEKTENRFSVRFKTGSVINSTSSEMDNFKAKVFVNQSGRIVVRKSYGEFDCRAFVYNATGQLLAVRLVVDDEQVVSAEMSQGVYFVKLKSQGFEDFIKLIVR